MTSENISCKNDQLISTNTASRINLVLLFVLYVYALNFKIVPTLESIICPVAIEINRLSLIKEPLKFSIPMYR